MPVDAVGGQAAAPYGFSVGANAQAAKDAAENKAATKLTDEQKEQMFLQKMNEGQKTENRPRTAENQDKLGKDDFMKLLIATLKYQDPSSPMDTQKLLEQTSVMTNMEQMIKMTEASQKAFEAQQKVQGTSMVGKTVVYDAVDAQGNAVTTAGKVDAIEFLAKGEVMLHIGNTKIKMDKVLGVADAGADEEANASVTDPLGKQIAAAKKKIATLESALNTAASSDYKRISEELTAARTGLAKLEKEQQEASAPAKTEATAPAQPAAGAPVAADGATQAAAASAAQSGAAGAAQPANTPKTTTDKSEQTSGAGASGEQE